MKRTALTPVSLTLVSLAALSGCDQRIPIDPGHENVNRVGLAPFTTCDDALAFAKEHALEQVGPYGFDGEHYGEDFAGEDSGAAGDGGGDGGGDDGGGGESAGDGNGGEDHSTTNVQELGVDEPDVVKTDGKRILALAQGKLHYIDLSSGEPTLTGALELSPQGDDYYDYGSNLEMLVNGDRVLVVRSTYGDSIAPDVRKALGHDAETWNTITEIIEVDVSNPSAPTIVESLYLDGGYVSSRKIDGTARFVLRSSVKGLAFRYPDDFLSENDYGYSGWEEQAYAQAEAAAESHNRSVIEATTIEDWIPNYVRRDANGELQTAQLVACDRAFEPGTFAGLGLLSVLTFDMTKGLALSDALGIFSEGETVYASKEGLYVATWPQYLEADDPEEIEGEIVSYLHKFDISQAQASYRGSGQVPGHLHSQWAMSEHEGDLRVATTDWGWNSGGSQSFVSVLRESDGELELVGQVDGIGLNEQIFGVRFIGETGYVVTFEQTDPLFTIDLSQPTAPQVVGELHIPGYSAYLHPMSEGILLGVGRDGDEEGNLSGVALNVFDVSDPAKPIRLHQAAFGGDWASSNIEWDHRAFLYWAPERLVVMPFTNWNYDDESYTTGALAYRVDAESGITLAGVIENEPLQTDEWGGSYGGEIQRSLVIGDELYTMSESGLQATLMSDMTGSGWLPF